MDTVLIIANETLGGRPLLDAVLERAAGGGVRFVICVPATRPRAGLVVYDDAVFDAAQTRVDLASRVLRSEGVDVIGEVGDSDAYSATMDAVREYRPTEIVVSTYPESRSGWMRSDLVERITQASGLPVTHLVADLDSEGLPFKVTLAVANRTASGDDLLKRLKEMAGDGATGESGLPQRVFIIVVPQEGGDGSAARRARTRLNLVLGRLREAGLFAAGVIGDPDPYTAITNALQYFRVDDIVISTFAETKSGWLRADLIERVRRATGKPVEHIVQQESETAAA